MADIAASDVTYTSLGHTLKTHNSRNVGVYTIAFGNGTLTYPAGGIPLTIGKMACPNQVEEFNIIDSANGNGFIYKYDATNKKIRIYQGDNTNTLAAALIELGNVAVVATSLSSRVCGW